MSYSISVRLQRTTVEESYVSVPVTEAIMRDQPNEDGTLGIDTTKLFAAAIELGARDDAIWQQEDQQTDLHPIQKAPDTVQDQLDAKA